MSENTTFTGISSDTLSYEDLERGIELIKSLPETSFLSYIDQNCTEEQLAKAFGEKKVGTPQDVYYGFPVYQRDYVPEGEVWMMDNNGKLIQRFKFN